MSMARRLLSHHYGRLTTISSTSSFRASSSLARAVSKNATTPLSVLTGKNYYQFNQFKFSSVATTVKDEEEKKVQEVDDSKKWLYDLGIPSLVPEWKKALSPTTLFQDISAGITVGCIAVPLSLAIAVASGVPAEVGLVTAAVSGVAGGMLGGTTLAVTGPAAAISLLVVGAVQEHGLEALPFITLACGGLQVVSGVTRLGVAAKLVPVSVIAGFTTGVGTMILTGQVPKALGIAAPAGMNPVETLMFLGEHLSSVNPAAAGLALGTSAAMYYLPKIHPKIPSALIAVGGATAATSAFGLDVSLIGAIPSGIEAFQFAIPTLPSAGSVPSLAATVFLIYAMTSAESLLSCSALEKMKKTNYKHNPDQELVGQGLANMGSAMFMGMPVTSVIARSSLNVRLNAATRLPAVVQAGFVFGSVVFFSDTIAMIPMSALSGMLIMTGLGMLNPQEFKHCYAVQKSDVIPFAMTFGGMVTCGLAEGIAIGCLSALAQNHDYGKLYVKQVELPHKTDSDVSTNAWQLDGPINFPSMFVIDDMMRKIAKSSSDKVVFDMKNVTSVEFTGMEELVNRLVETTHDTTTQIQMYNVNDSLEKALAHCDPSGTIQIIAEEAPFYFSHELETSEAKVAAEPVPIWYDSPNFRPNA